MEGRAWNHLRRLCTLIMALLMVFALGVIASADELTEEEEPECYNHGDVNGDGQVDNRDAIYTLYHAVYGDQFYPINQDWDFNGDTSLDNLDAIYLLYANLFPEDYALDGIVHGYYDPAWSWNGDLTEVSVTFKCSCGVDVTLNSAMEGSGITISTKVVKDATCTEPGAVEHTASITHDGKVYTDVKTTTIPALPEHQWIDDIEPGCEQGGQCAICGFAQEATGHQWALERTDEASCYEDAVEHYHCSSCGADRDEVLEGTAGHRYAACEPELHDENACSYVASRCTGCGSPNITDLITLHQYVAEIKEEATCGKEGLKIYRCRCGAEQLDEHGDLVTAPIPKNQDHAWEEVTGVEGVTHRCAACPETKLVITADEGKVDMTDHNTSVEVELDNNTTISMDDDTAAGLTGQVEITVETVSKHEIEMEGELREQIPGEEVYDFNMTDESGNPIESFNGSVTISLPYELEPGEDVDSIDIWYINDAGEVAKMENVTYNNGFVTFTTNHFSYYTVTRLTPAERCGIYGHIELEYTKAATCTQDGYHKVICQRCGATVEEEIFKAEGHQYGEPEQQDATCTEDGYIKKSCGCGNVYMQKLPALGHSMKLDAENSYNATCEHSGKTTYTCANGCGRSHVETLPQQEHRFEVTEIVEATCSGKGYVKEACPNCKQERIKEETAPLGHSYVVQGWTWDADYYGATLTLVCAHDEKHVKTQFAIATREEEKAVSCLGSGAVTYTVTLSVNGQTYTDVKTITTNAPGHKSDNTWHSNNGQHYYECTVCQAKLNVSAHIWGDPNVTQAATCAKAGKQTKACTVCGFEVEEVIPATGEHNLVFGVCKTCGFRSEECDHTIKNSTAVNLSGYAICKGIEVYLETCDCGERSYLNIEQLYCDMEYTNEEQVVLEDGSTRSRTIATCRNCGLTVVDTIYGTMREDVCRMYMAEERVVSLGGVELARTYEEEEDWYYTHPTVIADEIVDLTELGLCGEVLQVYFCPCGERIVYNNLQHCKWVYEEDGATCSGCGAIQTYTYELETLDEPCKRAEKQIVTYYLNGEVVYTYTNRFVGDMHDYIVEEYKLMGDVCTDGIFLRYTCTVCGDSYENYYDNHRGIFLEKTDLSGYGVCGTELYQYTCPCQMQYAQYHIMDDCDWAYHTYNPETQQESFICTECNAIRTVNAQHGEKDEHCYGIVHQVYTITDVNGKSFEATDSYYTTSHVWEQTYELLGESCVDGVKISNFCTDCGEGESYVEYWHINQLLETHDLGDHGQCHKRVSLYGCLCNANVNVQWESDNGNHCQWEYISGNEFGSTFRCANCGMEMTEASYPTYDQENCMVARSHSLTVTMNGEQLAHITWVTQEVGHTIHTEYTLKDGATSCEQGVTVKETCQFCDYENVYEEYYHTTYKVSEITYGEGIVCSPWTERTFSCPCGQEGWTDCSRPGPGCQTEGCFDEKLQVWGDRCTVCGVFSYSQSQEELKDGETCKYKVTVRNIYLYNYEQIYTNEWDYDSEMHSNLATFEMLGTTCQDGYRIIWVCQLCGNEERNENIFYDCEYWTTAKEALHDGTGICGPIEKHTEKCACGNLSIESVYYRCNLYWQSNENGVEVYKCENCGLEEHQSVVYTPGKTECQQIGTRTHTLVLNGDVIVSYQTEWISTNHWTVCKFDGNCDDGYYLIEDCVYCDYERRSEEMRTGHDLHLIEVINTGDLVGCEGYLEYVSCACGEYANVNGWESCQWQPTDNSGEEYCPVCDTYRYYTYDSQKDPETCTYTATWHTKWVRDGETLLEKTYACGGEDHDYVYAGSSLMVEGGTCEDGYTVFHECADCQKIQSAEGYWHNTYLARKLILGEQCGSYIEYYSCPCGKETHENHASWCNFSGNWWEETGADGLVHTFVDSTCSGCGLQKLDEDYYSPTGVNCEYVYHEISTYSRDGQVLATLESSYGTIRHNYQITDVVLKDGSVSCEDGIIYTNTCSGCGDSYNDEASYHAQMVVERIDLSEYGALCGGFLQRQICACGEYDLYVFESDDGCPFEERETDNWLTDVTVLDDVYQTTSMGGYWYDSRFLILTCPVTDPESCGFKIRMADVWIHEGCYAVRYEIWQLGYDPADGSCLKEIKIEKERNSYHAYTQTEINETLEDGTLVSGWRHACPTCGSYYEDTVRYVDDKMVKSQMTAVNMLDNDENQSYTYWFEYDFHLVGVDGYTYAITTAHYTEQIRADGTVAWEKDVYTYDEANFAKGYNCTRTVTHTSSYAEGETYTEDCHAVSYQEFYSGGSCTQDQTLNCVTRCVYCGMEESSEATDAQPVDHCWQWSDEMQTNVCSVCGLKNANGASGPVVLEDMTAKYDGSNYVVGYWNRDGIEYMVNVSVILYEPAEGQDDQLVLEGITVNEMTDVRAISCSKSEIQAAAALALQEANYTGSYAIQIAFVPVGGQYDLDCAITFDVQ